MNSPEMISDDAAWAAVRRRDRTADGHFVTGVLSTGIYCRPSCAARHPARANVRFFATAAQARAAGLRPCKRCAPDAVSRDEAAVRQVVELIATQGDIPRLSQLAAATGYSPSHLQRIFTRATGLSPAGYARARRAARAAEALSAAAGVTEAIYAAGYSAPSRFYEATKGRLGMAPSVWADKGRGVTIRWAVVATTLGAMLVAATEAGICRLTFGETSADLAARFPQATLIEGGEEFAELLVRVIAAVEAPGSDHTLPLDVRGTAFQEKVWRQLRAIPPGETRSYAELAAAAGHPNAVRAAGSANGANPVSVLIPCHRVVRGDGSLGGYAWGLDIKAELLRREAHTNE